MVGTPSDRSSDKGRVGPPGIAALAHHKRVDRLVVFIRWYRVEYRSGFNDANSQRSRRKSGTREKNLS